MQSDDGDKEDENARTLRRRTNNPDDDEEDLPPIDDIKGEDSEPTPPTPKKTLWDFVDHIVNAAATAAWCVFVLSADHTTLMLLFLANQL